MIRSIYEILTAKKYRHNDPEVGLLVRVGGYWRVESPKKTLGVSVKLHGSDRFGPSKYSLSTYKKRRNEIPKIWPKCIESVINETLDENGTAQFSKEEFVLAEIIFGPANKSGTEFAFAFNIESAPNEYGACVKNGRYECYYTLY